MLQELSKPLEQDGDLEKILEGTNEQESPEMQETDENQLPDIDLEPYELEELAKYPNELEAFLNERPTKRLRTSASEEDDESFLDYSFLEDDDSYGEIP